jgi:DNA topoisomerase VI subunit B
MAIGKEEKIKNSDEQMNEERLTREVDYYKKELNKISNLDKPKKVIHILGDVNAFLTHSFNSKGISKKKELALLSIFYEHFKKTQKFLNKFKQKSQNIPIYIATARILLVFNMMMNKKAVFNDLVKIHAKLDNLKCKELVFGHISSFIGSFYYNNGNFEQSAQYFEKSNQIYAKSEDNFENIKESEEFKRIVGTKDKILRKNVKSKKIPKKTVRKRKKMTRKRTPLVGFNYGNFKHTQYAIELVNNALDTIEKFQWNSIAVNKNPKFSYTMDEDFALENLRYLKHLEDIPVKIKLRRLLGEYPEKNSVDTSEIDTSDPTQIPTDSSDNQTSQTKNQKKEKVDSIRVLKDLVYDFLAPVKEIINKEPMVIIKIQEQKAPEELWEKGDKSDSLLYTFEIFDNGTGMTLPDFEEFGIYIANRKSQKLQQTREGQAFGSYRAFTDAQNTTGKPIVVISKHSSNQEGICSEFYTTENNTKEYTVKPTKIEVFFLHGTYIKLSYLNKKYTRGYIDSYVEKVAMMNPHVTIILIDPKNSEYTYPRTIDKFPNEPKFALPHPSSIKIGEFQDLLKRSRKLTVTEFLTDSFVSMSKTLAKSIVSEVKDLVISETKPSDLTPNQIGFLYKTFKNKKYKSPPTDTVIPVGEISLEASVIKRYNLKISNKLGYFGDLAEVINHMDDFEKKKLINKNLIKFNDPKLFIPDENIPNDFSFSDKWIGENTYSEMIFNIDLIDTIGDDFIAAHTRKPTSGKGLAFVVEAVMAYSPVIPYARKAATVITRYVNRTPKMRDNSNCALWKGIQSFNWEKYKVDDIFSNGIPKGNYVIFINCSGPYTHLMFKTQNKNALAEDEVLQKEVKLCLEVIGRKFKKYISNWEVKEAKRKVERDLKKSVAIKQSKEIREPEKEVKKQDKKETLQTTIETYTLDQPGIMAALKDGKWYTTGEIAKKMRISNRMDGRFLIIKLKTMANKDLISVGKKNDKNVWKIKIRKQEKNKK